MIKDIRAIEFKFKERELAIAIVTVQGVVITARVTATEMIGNVGLTES